MKFGKTIAVVRFIGRDVPDEVAFPLMMARFQRRTKIDPVTGCWNWQGKRGWNGYGQVCFRGTQWRINRLMYTIAIGPIPPGMVVMHTCDNRQCLNPEHLVMGTQKQNIHDCCYKFRRANQWGSGQGFKNATSLKGGVGL